MKTFKSVLASAAIAAGPLLQGVRLNGVAIGSASQPGPLMAITLPGGETFPLH